MIIPERTSYSRGVVRAPNGNIVLEFDPRINQNLAVMFADMGALVGLEVDISGLPDSFVLDGTTYNINYLEDVQQEVQDLLDAWETELGFTAAKTRRVVRPLLLLLRAMVKEGWF